MGIKERREREKQITRQAILTAAMKIARTEGWSALTIRKVGELIEYSPPMVYEYFGSKEEILLELIQNGFAQLNAGMQQAISSGDGDARLHQLADAYWQFAVDNPELYQLMHGTSGATFDKEIMAKSIMQVCDTAHNAIIEWAGQNGVELEDTFGATEIMWSLLHGLVSVYLLNRFAGGEVRVKGLLQQAVRSQLLGWKFSKKNSV
jgi:AcrR family transcriptional regulator